MGQRTIGGSTGIDTRAHAAAETSPGFIERIAPLVVYSNIFFVMLSLGVMAPALPEIQNDFGASYAAISMAITVFAVARLAMNLPAGYASGRYPRALLLMAGTLCVALGSFVSAFSQDMTVFLIGRALAGMGSSLSTTVGLTIVLGNAPKQGRGKASGTYHSALAGGAFFGPGFGGVLAAAWDWRASFLGAGAAALVSVAIIAAVAGAASRIWQSREQEDPEEDRPNTGEGMSTPARAGVDMLVIGVAFLAAFMIFFQRGAVRQTLVPLIAHDRIGLTTLAISIALMASALVSIVLGPWVGGLSDKLGRQRVLLPGFLVLAGGTALIAGAGTLPLFMAGLVLVSLAGTVNSVPASLLVDSVSAKSRGKVIGWYRVVGDFGLTIAPLIVGWLADIRGLAAGAYLSAVMIAAAAVALMFTSRRSRG